MPRYRFSLSLQNAIINHRARLGVSGVIEKSGKGGTTEGTTEGTTDEGITAPEALVPDQASNEKRALKARPGTLLAPKRLITWFRGKLLGPVQDRLDVLSIKLDVLSQKLDVLSQKLDQKLDVFNQELHAFRQSTEMILHALHEKFDDVRQETQQRFEQTQDRIDQIAEITQPTRSMIENALPKIEELALRLRVPLQIDEHTFSLRTSDGFVLVPRSDPVLLLKLLEAGPKGPEPGTHTILTKLLLPGMTFIDIGADVGLHTLAGARAVGPKGKVLAVEPTPKMFELLNRAIFFNGFAARVVTKCVAAGDRRQRTAWLVGEPVLRDRAQNDRETIEMEVWPLDELVAPGESVDLVKINFEAAVPAVVKGMTRIIEENLDLAIIAKFSPASLRELGISSDGWLATFAAYGFDAYAIDEESGEYRHVVSSELADTGSVNVAFLRPSSLAMSRVF